MKETYNYKKVFGYPVTIHRVTEHLTFPYGIPLSRIVLFAAILGVMWIFRGFFSAIGGMVPGGTLVIYLAVPFFLSGFLLKQKYNGKKIHYFLYDFLVYFFSIYLGKKKFANDEEVLYLDDSKVEFEEVVLRRKGGNSDETENSNQNRTRQSDVDKVG